MTPDEYQELAMRTKCSQLKAEERMIHKLYITEFKGEIVRIDPVQINHAVVGLAGDLGELASALEKWVYYGGSFDYVNMVEEVGDLLWYIAEACDALHISMSDVMEKNIAKLKLRYPTKFNETLAAEENRDRKAEAEAIATQGSTLKKDLEHMEKRWPTAAPIHNKLMEQAAHEAYKKSAVDTMLENLTPKCHNCATPFSDRVPHYCPECGVLQAKVKR